MTQHTIPCPDCGGTMRLKPSRFGPFYGCENWPVCDCTHGSHADGTPLGVPADKYTRGLRMAAHTEFDRLWKDGGPLSRTEAYLVLQELMGLPKEDAHIGRFNAQQCERLVGLLLGADGEQLTPQLSVLRKVTIPFGRYRGKRLENIPIVALSRLVQKARGPIKRMLTRYMGHPEIASQLAELEGA